MGWIDLGDGLTVYSVTDELVMMYEWIIEFVTSMSPFYFALMFIGLVVVILLGIAYKVQGVGERVFK